MWYIILLVLVYAAGHGVYLYNNDAKIKAKCKGKWVGDSILIVANQVWENHKFWYKDSNLEDTVEDIKKDSVKVVAQAKTKAKEVVQDITEEVIEVAAQAKEKIEKAKPVKTDKKSTKKSNTKPDVKTNTKATKGKSIPKKSK